MIPRRLTKHVKDQNWFAVVLDFLIVVAGVSFGIQLGNWNEARQNRADGSFYLSSIGEDIASDAAFLEANLINLQRESEAVLLANRQRIRTILDLIEAAQNKQ